MSNGRGDEERATQQLLAALTGRIEGGESGSDIAAAMVELVRTRGAREGIDAERQAALSAAINEFGAAFPAADQPAPAPDPSSNDPFERHGVKPPEQLRREAAALAQSVQSMRRAMAGMAHLTADIQRATRLPEAAPVLERVTAALHGTVQESLRSGGVTTSRFHQPTIALGDVHRDLQSVDSIEGLNRIRQDRLYPSLMRIRQTLLEGHAMVARPAMGRIDSQPNASHVQFLGDDAKRALLEPIADRLGLTLQRYRRGADEALNRWRALVSSYVVVCDLAAEDATTRAEVACQLGWARALGRPVVILTDGGQALPFDIDIEPVAAHDAEAIEAAMLDALFVPPRGGLDRAASRRTVTELQRLYADRSGVVEQALRLLTDDDDIDDGARYERIQSLLSLAAPDQPDLLTPAWPPAYPAAGRRSLFHVMPFGEGWSTAVSGAASAGAGAAYRRHDHVESDHIIRSLWDEIARASHVLVDITGLNDNVMIELGMAHALGKPTRVVAQTHVDLDALPPILRYWRVWHYDAASLATLTKIVRDFVAE